MTNPIHSFLLFWLPPVNVQLWLRTQRAILDRRRQVIEAAQAKLRIRHAAVVSAIEQLDHEARQ